MADKRQIKVPGEEVDGLVWILDGRVHVKNELKNGMPPMINPCDNIKMIINGVEVSRLAAVRENDVIELVTTDSETPLNIEIEISEDMLKAYAVYTPAKKTKFIIVDTYPINKLDITVQELILEAKPVSKAEILDEIRKNGIVYGINESAINEICGTNMPGRYLVAEGKPPGEPTDERVECFFNEETDRVIDISEDESGKVDYRNIVNYITVRPKDVIAKLHPAIPGTDGVTVTGEPIPARKPKSVTLLPSSSILIEDSTGYIRATKTGRPSKAVKGSTITFNIYERLTIDEVSMRTGNVRFKGDIEVKGNVYETMEVVARNNIFIKGNAHFCSIYAGNNLDIKGCAISSKIYTGVPNIIGKDPSPDINKIISGIGKLIEGINSLSSFDKEALDLNSMPEIVQYLLNMKNRDLPATIYEVINSLRKGNYDIDEDSLYLLIKKTRVFLNESCSDITSIDFLNDIIEMLKTTFMVKDNVKITGHFSIGYLLNSEVTSLGNVSITGKGCFNSKIYASGRILVLGNVRGGELVSEKRIEVNKSGSEMGVKTLLSVPENGTISIKQAFADTTIKFGNVPLKFLKEQRMVNARLVNGKIEY